MRTPLNAPFSTWLRTRGLAPTTTHNYSSLVRKIQAQVQPLTSEGIEEYIMDRPVHHRSPLRAAWRLYVTWGGSTGISLPDLPSRVSVEPLPASVLQAAHRLRVDGVTWQLMALLTWNVQPAISGLPGRVILLPPTGFGVGVVPVPQDVATTLQAWAWPGIQVTQAHLLFPEAPGSTVPAGAAALRRGVVALAQMAGAGTGHPDLQAGAT